jgi:hypothetical protein
MTLLPTIFSLPHGCKNLDATCVVFSFVSGNPRFRSSLFPRQMDRSAAPLHVVAGQSVTIIYLATLTMQRKPRWQVEVSTG